MKEGQIVRTSFGAEGRIIKVDNERQKVLMSIMCALRWVDVSEVIL